MITRVQLKNFRSIAWCDVELGGLCVLVGRNAVGKSTFLDAIRFVRDAVQVGLKQALLLRGGAPTLRRRPIAVDPLEIVLQFSDLSTPNLHGEYSLLLNYEAEGAVSVGKESCRMRLGGVELWFEREGSSFSTVLDADQGTLTRTTSAAIDPGDLLIKYLAIASPSLRRVIELLSSLRFYSPIPNVIRHSWPPATEAPVQQALDEQGSNLAAVLRSIQSNERAKRDLVSALGKIADGVTDVRVQDYGGHLFAWVFYGPEPTSTGFTLLQESDGTLRSLALLAALYQDHGSGSGMLGIEEPELSIHPGALSVLYDELVETSSRVQVLVATQSPDLISRFRADQLRIVERVNGETRIGPLDEAQREAIEESLFSAGDLLRIEGLRRQPPDRESQSA